MVACAAGVAVTSVLLIALKTLLQQSVALANMLATLRKGSND